MLAAIAFAALVGCDEPSRSEKPAAATGRFAAIAPAKGGAEARFCEKTYPVEGAGARAYKPPPVRTVLNPREGGGGRAIGWTWVNVWATWCAPCMEEMALLRVWKEGLRKEGVSIELSLLSVDAEADEPALRKVVEAGVGLPGEVPWIRSPEDLNPFLAGLGVEAGAALPIHALVDEKQRLRCVRVGAIHDRDYGAVKALLLGN